MRMRGSGMGTNQLLDSLTDHLALYHRKIGRPQSVTDTKGAARDKVLEWFRGLNIDQRQATLTITDKNWVAILLQMQKRLEREGAGYFFVLNDVLEFEPLNIVKGEASTSRQRTSKPEQELDLKKAQKSRKGRKRMSIQTSSTSSKSRQDDATDLPGLCFRKAKGLLARLEEQQVAGELLARNLELFMSGDVSADGDHRFLDTVSVSEDLVSNLDQFLAILDVITYGEFLTSVAGRGSSSWEELPWLKAMGYYTLPAFVVNKLELALWSAWLQSEGARRLPRALTKELRMTGCNLRTCPSDASASIICKRNKGFSGWWTNLTDDVKSNTLRYAVARAAKVEVMQTMRASCSSVSVGMQHSWKASTARGRLMRKSYFLDSDSEQWGAQLVRKESAVLPFMVGLDALRKLTLSSLQPTLSKGAKVNQSTEFGWLFHSSLDSVDTLPGRVMHRVRNSLKKVMLESTELELLRNESCRSQASYSQSKDSEGKVKKENRRKKIRNSVQSKVPAKSGNELVSEEQLENHVFQATACPIEASEEHMNDGKKGDQYDCDQGMQLEVELVNRKQNVKSAERKQGKKKKHSRAKLKAANDNFLNLSVYEEKYESSCKVKEEKKVETEIASDSLVCTENTLDSGLAGFSSPELFVSGNRIPHCADLQSIASHSEQLGLMEHEQSTACTVEDGFPATTDSHGSANVTNHDNCKSLDKPLDLLSLRGLCEERMQTEILIERTTTTGTPPDLPRQTAALCCGTEGICNKVNTHVSEKVDAERGAVICALNTHRKVSKGIDSGEPQCVFPPADNLSIPRILSRSSCSSPTTSDIYSHTEGLKPQVRHTHQHSTFGLSIPHEWPRAIQVRFPGVRSHFMPPATERLHLDVGRNWQQRLQASLMTLRSPVMIQQANPGSNSKRISSIQNRKSLDCPPMFPAGYNVTQTRGFPFGFREEPGFIPLSQPSYSSTFTGADFNVFARGQDESKHDDKTPEDTDYDDSNYFSGDLDEHEGFRISEEEGERQFVDLNLQRKGDYNQIFGGGVMYWNTADYAGMGYSRPPSLSSEDSSWARHEADLSAVLDDSTGLSPISGTFANGATPNIVSTSPPTASYHSGFDHSAVSITPRMGLPTSGNEFSGKFHPLPPTVLLTKPEDEQNKGPNGVATVSVLDGLASDIVPRPVLRPIIVVRDPSLSRQVSVSESLRRREARSPHVPCGRREMPRRRRPPSPVLRCVPPAPPPPPPSPVGGFGKRKGLTTVRSGSSSPRRWGLANSYHKEELDGPLVISGALEAATNSWRSRSMTNTSPMHTISGTLFRERLIAVPPLALEQEHPDVSLPMQTTLLFNSNPSLQSAITMLHSMLHEEIEGFCNQVVAENLLRKPFITTAVDKVAHALQVLWPRSRVRIFGSNATGLALPCSDVDLVVCLPPVRNLEPIKEAGILEGRNGIKETCLQHAARYLADQDWVKGDTLKTIENTAIPIIMLVAHVPSQLCNITEGGEPENFLLKPHLKETSMVYGQVLIDANGQSATDLLWDNVSIPASQASLSENRKGPWGGKADREFVRLDISFEAPSHTGVRTAELVRHLTAQFPAIVPLALVLKQFLTDRSLDHPYTGGLSSYCLVLLITRFLQHQQHLGWPFQQNLGSLLMDFLHFFGCIFDPRRMGVCIRGGGMYVSRDRGHSIDPLHIEDPLHPSNNVGRNCFRILQCVKAFADAYSYFEKALVEITDTSHTPVKGERFKILPNILPSVASMKSIP